MDTIFALSSGAPPAGIAVIRVSGPLAGDTLCAIAGRLPPPRRATAATLRRADGIELDHALVLWLPGPATATGEDVAELHLHGGRAVVAAVESALTTLAGLRRAEAGEFTRRAFANGRIDLAEAEGLADLLAAETEAQRRSAIAMADGALSRQVEAWRERVLAFSATIEAVLDFGDEDDVGGLPRDFTAMLGAFADELARWLERPRAETLKEGVRVVLAGPPNAGKSSLFNALLERDAAIISPMPGTTRDVLERPVGIGGTPFVLIDTAGIRHDTTDAVEAAGIHRAKGEVERADIVLWLGPEGAGPIGAWEIAAKSDLGTAKSENALRVSAMTGEGLPQLVRALQDAASKLLPIPGQVALNARQHVLLGEARDTIAEATKVGDTLVIAEHLRLARVSFDRIVGRTSTEDMLDSLFGRFCIGK